MWEKQVLLIPGPTPVPSQVLRAMGAPAINHRGPEFKALIQEVTVGLKEVYQTKSDVVVLSSSGTGAMEAAVANFLSPGDKALVVSIGNFGERFKKLCKIYGVDLEAMDFPWGTAADPQAVARRLAEDTGHQIKAVLVQYNETSTGVLNDIKAISEARGNHPALLIVDAISALAAAELKTDEWNLDVVISGSQKAFMIPPGLAMVSVNARAWEVAAENTNRKFYFDLQAARDSLKSGQTPYTPAVSLFVGLREALRMMLEEGLPAMLARHALYRDMVRAGVKSLGLELLAGDAVASPAVTAIKVPAGFKPADINKRMREKYGVVLAGGQGKLKEDIFRIGHLGYVQPVDLFAAFAALELVLKELGIPVTLGAGVAAVQQVLAERSE
ncbi:class V aminotransferase [Clostridiales bacterium PH28_bin88]|nr:class V aminotransferase [Clostridiales bacterium PH28_bin88]